MFTFKTFETKRFNRQNSLNGDGFSPLDIAMMTMNIPMIRLLQSYGAKESNSCKHLFRIINEILRVNPNLIINEKCLVVTKESRVTQLNSLLKEAERCVLDLNVCVFGVSTNGGLSAALLKVNEN